MPLHALTVRASLPSALATIALLLAACAGTTSPAASTPASAAASTEATAAASASTGATSARCSVTPDATSAQTITITGSQFGGEVTVAPGEAVTFTNDDSFGHTVTEGTGGSAAADACVDEPIAAGESVVVTFNEAGDYDITCTIHSSMQTAVHVE